MKWTTKQEEIIRECATLGVDYIVKEIHLQTGVLRTAEATQRHASRIGVSLIVYQTCPRCGRRRKSLNRTTGLCEWCNDKELYERALRKKADLTRLRKELNEDASKSPERKRIRKEYRAVQRFNERQAKALAELQQPFGKVLSEEMSSPSSEVEFSPNKEESAPKDAP